MRGLTWKPDTARPHLEAELVTSGTWAVTHHRSNHVAPRTFSTRQTEDEEDNQWSVIDFLTSVFYMCVVLFCHLLCLRSVCLWDFPEIFPARVGVNPNLSSVLSFVHLCCVSFVTEWLSVALTHLHQHMYLTALPFTAFSSGSSYDCPPSQSLREHSRETRHAQSACFYHVYLCSSRVSFPLFFHLLPSFIVCNISSGLTG